MRNTPHPDIAITYGRPMQYGDAQKLALEREVLTSYGQSLFVEIALFR